MFYALLMIIGSFFKGKACVGSFPTRIVISPNQLAGLKWVRIGVKGGLVCKVERISANGG